MVMDFSLSWDSGIVPHYIPFPPAARVNDESDTITLMNKKEYIPKAALSIHAHPDDQEFTVAGTLAKWAKSGCRIVSVIVTSGDAGSNDPSQDSTYKSILAQLRETEQTDACAVLGIAETVFLRYPDGALEPTLKLRRDLTRLIRRYKPEAVVIGDPQTIFYGNGYINHPDHRAAAQAALYAVFPSSETRLIFTELLDEGLVPHKVGRLYVHGSEKSDTWVDITETIDLKIAALKKHKSQLGDWDPTEMIHKWASEEGNDHEMVFAEAYKVMILDEENRD
jgi:LmbE family N-acetylglucosaminyl deacetylase